MASASYTSFARTLRHFSKNMFRCRFPRVSGEGKKQAQDDVLQSRYLELFKAVARCLIAVCLRRTPQNVVRCSANVPRFAIAGRIVRAVWRRGRDPFCWILSDSDPFVTCALSRGGATGTGTCSAGTAPQYCSLKIQQHGREKHVKHKPSTIMAGR